jgi:NhaP-type Na+/H+ or K+/H+ antiporter
MRTAEILLHLSLLMDATFISYIFLLLIIVFLVMVARRLKISYPIILVLGGLVLGFIPQLPAIEIDPELIFVIFLPPLLYEAAWETSWKDFWRWRRVITSFAFIIVIITAGVVAIVSNSLIPGFTLALGFLLGGIVSPPDAVSATTIMKSVSVPKRLSAIVEGESLLNDEATTSFFVVIIMGVAVGLAIAMVFYAIHRWLPTTPAIDIVLTFVTPYVMYIVAEHFHFSGVLAVVSGGLLLSHKQQTMLSATSRIQGLNVWSIVGFVLNGLIFMLIGLQLPVIVKDLGNTSLTDAITYGLIITAVLIVGRLLSTFGATLFTMVIGNVITVADKNPGWRGPLLLGWAGMRGVVSLAAALSIPAGFPQRSLIIFITFTVILVTLVFQGLTLPALIKWVNMDDPDYPMPSYEQEVRVQKKLHKAALEVLNEKYGNDISSHKLAEGLKHKIEGELRLLDHARLPETPQEAIDNDALAGYIEMASKIIIAQRELLHKLNKKAEVDEDIVKKYLLALDHEEERLREQKYLLSV